MNRTLIEIGDSATIQVAKENRYWGYNPAPDGTPVTIIEFGTIHFGRTNNCCKRPGVYLNRCWPVVKLPDGKTMTIGTPEPVLSRNCGGRFKMLSKKPSGFFENIKRPNLRRKIREVRVCIVRLGLRCAISDGRLSRMNEP